MPWTFTIGLRTKLQCRAEPVCLLAQSYHGWTWGPLNSLSFQIRLHPSQKMSPSHPETPERKNHKITNTQLPPSCVLTDSCCLIRGATQLDCRMKFLILFAN